MSRSPGSSLPTTTTRMTWLYNTLSHYGESFEFGQASRAWLVDRLAVSDFSSRRDRTPSEWWEDTENKNNNNSYPGNSNNGSNGNSITSSTASLSALKPKVLSHAPSSGSLRVQKDPPPDLSLAQVLASSTYRADFENFLEENLAGPALPFREVVQEWQDKYKTAHVWDPKGLDRLKLEAVKIYQQYLAPTASEKLDVDRLTLLRLKKALKVEAQPPQLLRSPSENADDLDSLTVNQLLERAELYADHALARRVLDTLQVIPQEDQEGLCERAFAILTDKVKPKLMVDPDDDGVPVEFSGTIFVEALKQITQMLETLFSDFKQTDDYSDMFEPEVIVRQSSVTTEMEKEENNIGNGTNSGGGGSVEEGSNDDIALENDTGRVRCPPWYNIEGWRSLRCEILDLHTKLSNVRAIINLDSTTYRTSLADRDFRAGVQADFAVTNTTQYLTIRLRTGNRLAGVLDLSMAAISQMTQGAETLHSVKQVSKNQNLAKMELKLKITCRKDDPAPCALQQVLVEGSKGGFTTTLARGLVSKKKRRFQQDGFDLDLSYVTDQLIAMGYPSSGAEGVYRNPLDSVQKFFSLRHPQAYLLYNLCSERQYDVSKFQGRVRHYPCDDHHPPPFAMIKRFCEDVRQFLNEHPQHAVSVHCKAGKGRTGTMLAAYMCYTGMEPNSTAALATFAQSRTKNGKGVTIPSQERYVHYFGKYCKLKRAGKRAPGRTTLVLQSVNLHDALLQSNSTIVFSVTQRPEKEDEVFKEPFNNEDKPIWNKYYKSLRWDMSKHVLALNDDVLFEFYEKTLSGNKVKLFQFWFNTRMAELKYLDSNSEDLEPRLILEKKELDKASKDTKHKDYSPDFKVELVFALTCSSGMLKSQELDERSETARVAVRKQPPPLPASYSSKRLVASDRESIDDESFRHSKTATLSPEIATSRSFLLRAPSSLDLPTSTVTTATSPTDISIETVILHNKIVSSSASNVELPEPSSPVPGKVLEPLDDGLEERFALGEPALMPSARDQDKTGASLSTPDIPPPPQETAPDSLVGGEVFNSLPSSQVEVHQRCTETEPEVVKASECRIEPNENTQTLAIDEGSAKSSSAVNSPFSPRDDVETKSSNDVIENKPAPIRRIPTGESLPDTSSALAPVLDTVLDVTPFVKVATLPKTFEAPLPSDLGAPGLKVATLPRKLSHTEKITTLPRAPSGEAPNGGFTEETTEAFCERLFGASKPRMDMALAALTSFGVEVPRVDMDPWIERDWLDFEKSTNKVIRAKVQTDLATVVKVDRYETLRRQAEEAEAALRAEIRSKPPPPPAKRVQGLARAYEANVSKQ